MNDLPTSAPPSARPRRPHVVVLGNEKGGTGKSTTAMHLIVALLREGHSVGALDLDARQGTLSRHITNRRETAARRRADLLQPVLRTLLPNDLPDRSAAEAADAAAVAATLGELAGCEFVVIDTPGRDDALSRAGHAHADTLVTPINDSFVDLDLLARVDPETHAVLAPSTYSELVWNQKKARALRDRGSIDWIVVRNRLSSLESKNQRAIGEVLEALARRIGFRLAPGFGERVIFRELFLDGLTLFDLREIGVGVGLTMSHVAALQEVRGLLRTIGLVPPAGESATVAGSTADPT
ncbi:MAG: ATPase [Alphaproteobacteria bacterium]|nr:ATPase [Alphaproteobacteria bacterium]